MRWIMVGLVVVFAALALGADSCSTEGDQPRSGKQSESSSKPSGQPSQRALLRGTYENARDTCGAFPPAEVAKQLGLPADASVDEIADEYSLGYTGPHQPFAFDGCFEGLLVG